MNIAYSLLLQIILIILNAIFACAEIAIISVNEAKAEKMISDGNKNAKSLLRLIKNPAKLLATIQVAITLSGFLGSAFAADNFAGVLVDKMTAWGWVNEQNAGVFDTISVILITLTLSYITLVFGELVPKRLAMKKSEKIAIVLSRPIEFVSKIFTPLIWLLTSSVNIVLHLLGINPNEGENEIDEEEILLMVDSSRKKGFIDKKEQFMIENVFEFDDIMVKEFSTHRKNVEFLWVEDSIEEWDKMIKKSFHKYYPVCNNSVDDVIGILDSREYFKLNEKTKENIFNRVIKTAHFVPETLHADKLFNQMKKSNNKISVVVDEYGGVTGIVTMDDILEQIVGDFNKDDTDGKIIKREENMWEIYRSVSVEEVNETIGVNFSADEFETFGGLVLSKYGNIPLNDTTFEIDIENLNIKVLKIKELKIERMIVTKKL